MKYHMKYGTLLAFLLAATSVVSTQLRGDLHTLSGSWLGLLCIPAVLLLAIGKARAQVYSGKMTFNKGCRTGMQISLLASGMYAIFMFVYSLYYFTGKMKFDVRFRLFGLLMTFLGIYVLGFVFSLICAAIVSRKQNHNATTV